VIIHIPLWTLWLLPWVFWVGFVFSISVYRRWQQGKLNLLCKILSMPIILPFSVLDVIFNYTVLVALYGFPSKRDYTISSRFETYRKTNQIKKRKLADFTCEQLLNPIDPFDTHC